MTLENGVIADLLDADKNTAVLLDAVRETGLKADYFTDNASRTAFAAILAAKSFDAAVLLEHAKRAAGVKFVSEVIPQVSAVNAAAIQRIRELAELIRERPVKATEAREMAQKLFNSKARGERAYKFLKANLEGFGLKSLLTGNNNSRYYGTEEALENLRKTVFLHP